MSRSWLPLLLMALVLLTGCSESPESPAAAPGKSPVAEVPSRPAPPTAAGWNKQAEEYLNQQRWAEAIEAAREAIRLEPAGARAWWLLGRAQLGAGQAEAALESLHTAQSRYPDFVPEIVYALGQAYEADGQMEEALRNYALLKQVQGGDPAWSTAADRLRERLAPAEAAPRESPPPPGAK